jgi:hypothetical protein
VSRGADDSRHPKRAQAGQGSVASSRGMLIAGPLTAPDYRGADGTRYFSRNDDRTWKKITSHKIAYVGSRPCCSLNCLLPHQGCFTSRHQQDQDLGRLTSVPHQNLPYRAAPCDPVSL